MGLEEAEEVLEDVVEVALEIEGAEEVDEEGSIHLVVGAEALPEAGAEVVEEVSKEERRLL